MSLPTKEFIEWQAYFDIYPFQIDREARQFSMLLAFIYNTAGKMFKKNMPIDAFLPDYLRKQPVQVVWKTKEEQKAEFAAFRMKLQSLSPRSVRKISKDDNHA